MQTRSFGLILHFYATLCPLSFFLCSGVAAHRQRHLRHKRCHVSADGAEPAGWITGHRDAQRTRPVESEAEPLCRHQETETYGCVNSSASIVSFDSVTITQKCTLRKEMLSAKFSPLSQQHSLTLVFFRNILH